MAELVFERAGIALEVTSGTAIAAPTHYLPFPLDLKPAQTIYRPEEARGTRARYNRSRVVKKWSEWEIPATGIDVYNLPVLMNMVAPVTVPTTPGGGTTTRLWTFTRSQAAATEKTVTLFDGDPNIQSFRAPYGVLDEFTFSSDASGDDAATMTFAGRAQIMEKIAGPVFPAQLISPMVTPLESQLWIDSGATAIGTTAITGRVISAEFSVSELRGDPKFLFAGPATTKTFNRFGANTSYATLALSFEVPDMVQYDQLMAETVLKVRVRMNGPLIEGALYHYVEYDIYGIFDEPDWGEAFGTNRTLSLNITSQTDITAAHDWIVRVQNDRATL